MRNITEVLERQNECFRWKPSSAWCLPVGNSTHLGKSCLAKRAFTVALQEKVVTEIRWRDSTAIGINIKTKN